MKRRIIVYYKTVNPIGPSHTWHSFPRHHQHQSYALISELPLLIITRHGLFRLTTVTQHCLSTYFQFLLCTLRIFGGRWPAVRLMPPGRDFDSWRIFICHLPVISFHYLFSFILFV